MRQLEKDRILNKCLSKYFDIDKAPDSRLLDRKYTIIFTPEQKELYKKIKNKNFDKIVNDLILEEIS